MRTMKLEKWPAPTSTFPWQAAISIVGKRMENSAFLGLNHLSIASRIKAAKDFRHFGFAHWRNIFSRGLGVFRFRREPSG